VTTSTADFRYIVRIIGTDIDGLKKLPIGLLKIKGINRRLADAIVKVAGFDPEMPIGNLKDTDIKKLENVIKDPSKFGVPVWLLNYQKDLETGKDLHLTGPDLTLSTRSGIKLMIESRSWKGVRHSFGLKVRGQRTRTTGRKGRVVGVKRKRVAAAR
jgi:small subunit ribosomal protein S13